MPGEATSKQWEERFGEYAYLPLVEQSVTDALKSAGLTITEIDHVIADSGAALVIRSAADIQRLQTLPDDALVQGPNGARATAGEIRAVAAERRNAPALNLGNGGRRPAIRVQGAR